MGKKRTREQIHEEAVEAEELEAEMRALQQMKVEQQGETSTNTTNYNKEGLLKSIEGMSLPFEESMQICEFSVEVQDENDDLERELAFYNQTIRAVNLGRDRLEALGIPTKRPIDYFCEQVKSDAHMAKIKDRLLLEEKKIEGFEKRLQRDSNRKFNKQIAAVKKEERSKSATKLVDAVSDLRKGKKGGVEAGLEKILEGDERKKSFKRIGMDKKYGFGGKDGRKKKLNDKKSINDLSDYNPRGGKLVRRDAAFKGAAGKKKGKPNRPGKANREKSRSERRS